MNLEALVIIGILTLILAILLFVPAYYFIRWLRPHCADRANTPPSFVVHVMALAPIAVLQSYSMLHEYFPEPGGVAGAMIFLVYSLFAIFGLAGLFYILARWDTYLHNYARLKKNRG